MTYFIKRYNNSGFVSGVCNNLHAYDNTGEIRINKALRFYNTELKYIRRGCAYLSRKHILV